MQKRIGRGKDNDLIVPSDFAKVSTHHCVVELQSDGNYYLTDIGSRNGTTINGQLIPQNKPQRIGPVDEIILGNQYTLTWNQILSLFNEKPKRKKLSSSYESFSPVPAQETSEYIYKYAGFWVRFGAGFVDGLIINVILSFFIFFFGLFTGSVSVNFRSIEPFKGFLLFLSPIILIGVWLYFALQWSSKYQATLGMRLFQIFLVDTNLERISFGRATGRFFAGFLSCLMIIGHIMCGFHPEKRTFHDIISKTRVIRYERNETHLQKGHFNNI